MATELTEIRRRLDILEGVAAAGPTTLVRTATMSAAARQATMGVETNQSSMEFANAVSELAAKYGVLVEYDIKPVVGDKVVPGAAAACCCCCCCM